MKASFIEPDVNETGTKYIDEHYKELVSYASKKLGQYKFNCDMIVNDLYIKISEMQVSGEWIADDEQAQYSVYAFLKNRCKQFNYKNDIDGHRHEMDSVDIDKLENILHATYGTGDGVDTKDYIESTLKELENKAKNGDCNSKLILYSYENTEDCLNMDTSIYDCLDKDEKLVLYNILDYKSRNH